MPEVRVSYPADLFTGEEMAIFKKTLKNAAACEMDANNPITGERTNFCANPDGMIDLVMIPYAPVSEVTALVLVTIITFDWPDRQASMSGRLRVMGEMMKPHVPRRGLQDGQDLISFSFIGKQADCWYAVPA